MSNNADTIIELVMVQLNKNEIIEEKSIEQFVKFYRQINPISDEEEPLIIKILHSRLGVRMERGSCIKELDHVSWFYSAKKDIESLYWDRYRMFLIKKGFNNIVMGALDSSTDEMMDLLGDPNSLMNFSRKGLVIGDVQSGKTSNYIGLINKAVDSGYKIIILLTGTIEKLRKQTQQRLDEGFIGLDSTAYFKGESEVRVGVGSIDARVSSVSITSTTNDFNSSVARQLVGQLSSFKDPVLFVVKKNKSVLEQLENWLSTYNRQGTNKIEKPLLLIDDEADNASVNTRKLGESPTTINACIRKLLKLFTKSSYVAFTATPYANIFINPESSQEMLEDDLFPKDFIYALEAPSNYIGARDIFGENGNYSYMVKNNDDCNDYIPESHKKTFSPEELAPSMKEAIVSFLLVNVIRDLRGDDKKHQTMMINVSRFIDVQNELSRIIDAYVRDIQRDVRNYYLMGKSALKHYNIEYIKSVYDKYFLVLPERTTTSESVFSWDIIQKSLHSSIASIVVRAINGGNAAKNLNYDDYKEDGLRLIAVGGFSLSRGLTLEGLSISYFYRNSKMYDTLMQMGRWFGYRPRYEDLCQVWMGERSEDWYGYISEATDELCCEISRMCNARLTPKEFGLKVRSDKESLIVTALNKMRMAQDFTRVISLNGKNIETPYITYDKKIVKDNMIVTKNWFEHLLDKGNKFVDISNMALKYNQMLNVPKEEIIDYLSLFDISYLNMNFRAKDISKILLENNDHALDNWDVVIAQGEDKIEGFCGLQIPKVRRRFEIKASSRVLQISGKRSRLGSASIGKGGLTYNKCKIIENKIITYRPVRDRKKAFYQNEYFNTGDERNPQLVIYPLALNPISKNSEGKDEIDKEKQKFSIDLKDLTLIGLGIGIPRIDGKENQTIEYKMNLVGLKELMGINSDDDIYEIDETLD